jgi:hypothetical protein
MRSGTPLTDADRLPWLRKIAAEIDGWRARGECGVLTCSALAGRPFLKRAAQRGREQGCDRAFARSRDTHQHDDHRPGDGVRKGGGPNALRLLVGSCHAKSGIMSAAWKAPPKLLDLPEFTGPMTLGAAIAITQ